MQSASAGLVAARGLGRPARRCWGDPQQEGKHPIAKPRPLERSKDHLNTDSGKLLVLSQPGRATYPARRQATQQQATAHKTFSTHPRASGCPTSRPAESRIVLWAVMEQRFPDLVTPLHVAFLIWASISVGKLAPPGHWKSSPGTLQYHPDRPEQDNMHFEMFPQKEL